MIVTCSVVDFVDGVNHIHNILHGYGLVGAKHYCGLAVVSNIGIDEVGELGFIGGIVVNEILVLVVDVNRDGLLGHGLATA